MAAELHLPDLPEVRLTLAPAEPRARLRAPWHLRLREAVVAYLPLLLMALLALGTWWLVKLTPAPATPREAAAPRQEPDYTVRNFVLERFEPGGRLKLRIEGAQMRHFPADGRFEIDDVRIRAYAPDGRRTLASARRALSNADNSEVQLLGGAQVTAEQPAPGAPVEIRGEALQAFLNAQRLRSKLPVVVKRGADELRAGSLDYDHAAGLMDLQGGAQARLAALP